MSVVSLVLAPWFVRVHGMGGETGLSSVIERVLALFG